MISELKTMFNKAKVDNKTCFLKFDEAIEIIKFKLNIIVNHVRKVFVLNRCIDKQ
jgi:hypothetical protein